MQRESIVRFLEQYSDVPKELRSDIRYLKERGILVRLLIQWQVIEEFAIHEACHENYFLKAGCTEIEFLPSTILYRPDNQENPFDGQLARIKIKNWVQPETDDWLFLLAKGFAAGGMATRKRDLLDYPGDTIDRRLFNAVWNGTDEHFKIGFADSEKMWIKAQEAVEDDIKDSRLWSSILKRGKEVIPLLFPWTQYE